MRWQLLLMLALTGCARETPAPSISDEEKILHAARYVVYERASFVQVTDPLWEGRPAVPYETGKELLAENPGCCRIGVHSFEMRPPKCREPHSLVTLSYGARYVARDGSVGRAHKERMIAVTNDGRICAKDGV